MARIFTNWDTLFVKIHAIRSGFNITIIAYSETKAIYYSVKFKISIYKFNKWNKICGFSGKAFTELSFEII